MDRLHQALNRISERRPGPSASDEAAAPSGAIATIEPRAGEPQRTANSETANRATATLDQLEQNLATLLGELAIDEYEIQVPALPAEQPAFVLAPEPFYAETAAGPAPFESLNFCESPLPASRVEPESVEPANDPIPAAPADLHLSFDLLLADLRSGLAIDEQEIQVPAPPVDASAVVQAPAANFTESVEAPQRFEELELPANPPIAIHVEAPSSTTDREVPAAGETTSHAGEPTVATEIEELRQPTRVEEPVANQPPSDPILMPGPSWRPNVGSAEVQASTEHATHPAAGETVFEPADDLEPGRFFELEPPIDLPSADEPPQSNDMNAAPKSFFELASQPAATAPELDAQEIILREALASAPAINLPQPQQQPIGSEPLVAMPAEQPSLPHEQYKHSPIDELRDHMSADLAAGQAHTIGLVAVAGSANHSSTVAQLAESFARLGHGNVLAVDATFGVSQLADDLGAQSSSGIIPWLAANSGAGIDYVETRIAGVSFLGGGAGANPNLLLGDPRWSRLDALCRKSHRWTIIDAGEARGTGQVYASLCDAVYLLICLQETPRREANAAIERLHDAGVRLRGCILIGDDAALDHDASWPLAAN